MFLFQVGSTKEGVINGIDVDLYIDSGWEPNDHAVPFAVTHVDNGTCDNVVAYNLSREGMTHTFC